MKTLVGVVGRFVEAHFCLLVCCCDVVVPKQKIKILYIWKILSMIIVSISPQNVRAHHFVCVRSVPQPSLSTSKYYTSVPASDITVGISRFRVSAKWSIRGFGSASAFRRLFSHTRRFLDAARVLVVMGTGLVLRQIPMEPASRALAKMESVLIVLRQIPMELARLGTLAEMEGVFA